MTWHEPREILARHGLDPKRAFSQNFLVSRSHAERIAELASMAGLPVVEMGPGLGTLTALILERAPQVIAVEADRDMIAVLNAEFAASTKLDVREGDAVTFDLTAASAELASPLVVAGNLPYSVTGGIMRNVVTHHAVIAQAYLMVQREVRERIVAQPSTKAYGALTVFLRSCFKARSVLELAPGCFFPAPKVASSIVQFLPREPGPRPPTSAFESVVGAAFRARRKTLRNALLLIPAHGADPRQGPVDAALARAEIDGQRRGETLTVPEFERLAFAWAELADGPGTP
jgi:16S rRNA (adenine1518-N6/adenine1519-N6)-dimethyltransferase